MEKEEKVSLIFQLFDEDRSGFLSEEEIREILKATHLQTADAVNAKLATLMKQARVRPTERAMWTSSHADERSDACIVRCVPVRCRSSRRTAR